MAAAARIPSGRRSAAQLRRGAGADASPISACPRRMASSATACSMLGPRPSVMKAELDGRRSLRRSRRPSTPRAKAARRPPDATELRSSLASIRPRRWRGRRAKAREPRRLSAGRLASTAKPLAARLHDPHRQLSRTAKPSPLPGSRGARLRPARNSGLPLRQCRRGAGQALRRRGRQRCLSMR